MALMCTVAGGCAQGSPSICMWSFSVARTRSSLHLMSRRHLPPRPLVVTSFQPSEKTSSTVTTSKMPSSQFDSLSLPHKLRPPAYDCRFKY